MADVKYLITVDATGAIKVVKDFDGALDNLAKTSGKTTTAHEGLWKQFAIGQIAVNLATKALRALEAQFFACIKGAIDEEKSEKALQAALEITGRTVEGNLKHYLDFAEAQMKVTTYTHEEVEASQALLLQMTNLDQNGIDRATKGAMGLASTMGIDLHSATMMVTKAMEGNYQALGRVGIKVSETMTAEEKHDYILGRLSDLYQRSVKEADTFGGSLKQLKNSWGEVQEEVGKAIIGNESVQRTIKDLKGWLDKISQSPDFKLWMSDVVNGMVAIAKGAAWVVTGLRNIANELHGVNKADKELTEAQIKLNAALDRARAAGHDVDQVARAIAEAHKKEAEAVKETGSIVRAATDEDNKAVEAKKKLADAAQDIIDRANPLDGALRKLGVDQAILNKAFEKGIIDAKGLQKGIDGLKDEYVRLVKPVDSADDALLKMAMDARNRFIPAMSDSGIAAQKAAAKTKQSWTEAAQSWITKNQETWQAVLACANAAVNGIDNALKQSLNNKMLLLDKEYQARLDFIKKSTMSEAEKNKAIEALDAEYDMKRRELQRKAAEQGKAVAIMQAIVNVAEGVTKALASGIPPWNFILAGITAAAGAIQIALIRAQPIPLAAGGIFKKPVFSSGADYMAGEAGPEAVIPLRELPRMMRELGLTRGGGGGASDRPITLHAHIYIAGKKIEDQVIKIVEEAGQLGRLRLAGKVVT